MITIFINFIPNPIITISLFSEAWKQEKYWRSLEAVFPFSPQIQIATEGPATDFPT